MFEKLSQTHSITALENFQESSKRLEVCRLKKAGKSLVAEKYKDRAIEKSRGLEVQGDLARLMEDEKKNMDWQSLIYSVPRGVMAFAARAPTNRLAYPDNLARWKKIVHPKYSISPCTLGHLLSNCQQARDQYERRHNNIVKYLHSTASSQGMEA